MKRFPAVLLSVLGFTTAAQAADHAPVHSAQPLSLTAHFIQFAQEVEAFARLPMTSTAPVTRVPEALFVGSSSIRLWNVASSFPELQAINRGFGGATTADVLHYYPKVIAGTAPSSIMVYVGENDIADGVAPEKVAKDVEMLLTQLRRDMPKARIVYLSMKPTPARWDLYPRMIEVNEAIRKHSQNGGFDYLDVGSALLTQGGQPNEEYFGADHLHMNARGYALWNAIVDKHLGVTPHAKPVQTAQVAQAAS